MQSITFQPYSASQEICTRSAHTPLRTHRITTTKQITTKPHAYVCDNLYITFPCKILLTSLLYSLPTPFKKRVQNTSMEHSQCRVCVLWKFSIYINPAFTCRQSTSSHDYCTPPLPTPTLTSYKENFVFISPSPKIINLNATFHKHYTSNRIFRQNWNITDN